MGHIFLIHHMPDNFFLGNQKLSGGLSLSITSVMTRLALVVLIMHCKMPSAITISNNNLKKQNKKFITDYL